MIEKYVNFDISSKLTTMNIQAEKQSIIERFRQINDTSLINTIKSILDYAQDTKSNRISLEEYNKELELAELEITEGKGITHAEFKEKMAQW